MNILSVGRDPTALLSHLPKRFLLIDSGQLIDRITLPHAKVFDVHRHSFNPLRKTTHRSARELADIFYSADPGGDATLTVRNGRRALAKLLMSFSRLDELTGDRKDPAVLDALGVVENALFSPVLRRVLTGPENFSFSGRVQGKRTPSVILARIDPAELGPFDAFLLGNLLIAQFQGAIVVPQFGFYATASHKELILQDRLIAGINFFDEVPQLKNELLLIERKIGRATTPDDARLLAEFEGLVPGTVEHTDWVYRTIKG